MIRRATIVLLSATSLACGEGSGPESASPVAGTWSYDADQDAPPAALHGSLSWTGVVGGFEGTFSVVEQRASGEMQTFSGATAGQILSDSIADFDFIVQGAARRHLGILRGDSISGSWVLQGPSGSATGRFVLRRG